MEDDRERDGGRVRVGVDDAEEGEGGRVDNRGMGMRRGPRG